ncbi:MAG: alpha/beta fold hydrolase [Blastocatellia bacterium]|nr:alpha/beta fold hydrolase [Blastocatellia bacterium]
MRVREEKSQRNYLIWAGGILTLSGLLVYLLNTTALAVVVDLPFVGVMILALALLLLLPGLWRSLKSQAGYVRKIAGSCALLLAFILMILLLILRFFSYDQQQVSFRNGDVELSGTLYTPKASGTHPAAVFIHGSGRQTRDEYAFYARFLAQQGIASLTYDKRGSGASTGELYKSDYGDYANDALAAVRLLREQPQVDAGRIGLIGFSEGEWVAPLAAMRSGEIAFVVVIGASGVSPAEQVNAEIEARLQAKGYSGDFIKQALTLNEKVFAYQRTGEGADSLKAALQEAKQQTWFRDAEDIPEEVYPIEDYAWWRSVMDFKPAPVWEQVKAPVLVLKGGRDPNSPAERAKHEIETALLRGGNSNFKVVVFPKGDHMLLEWPLGERVPPPIFTEGYLNELVTWIQEQTGVG